MDSRDASALMTTPADFMSFSADVIQMTNLFELTTREYIHRNKSLQHKDKTRRIFVTQSYALVDSGFTLLYASTLVNLWGGFDVAIDDMCVAWLVHTDGAFIQDDARRSKVVLGSLIGKTETEQSLSYLSAIRSQFATGTAVESGFNPKVLAAIGLGPADVPQIRETLKISKEIRNVCAHRANRADQRFVERCPEFGASVGQVIDVRYAQLLATATAMLLYLDALSATAAQTLDIKHEALEPPWLADPDLMVKWVLGTHESRAPGEHPTAERPFD